MKNLNNGAYHTVARDYQNVPNSHPKRIRHKKEKTHLDEAIENLKEVASHYTLELNLDLLVPLFFLVNLDHLGFWGCLSAVIIASYVFKIEKKGEE
jgi:hypothetical protein